MAKSDETKEPKIKKLKIKKKKKKLIKPAEAQVAENTAASTVVKTEERVPRNQVPVDDAHEMTMSIRDNEVRIFGHFGFIPTATLESFVFENMGLPPRKYPNADSFRENFMSIAGMALPITGIAIVETIQGHFYVHSGVEEDVDHPFTAADVGSFYEAFFNQIRTGLENLDVRMNHMHYAWYGLSAATDRSQLRIGSRYAPRYIRQIVRTTTYAGQSYNLAKTMDGSSLDSMSEEYTQSYLLGLTDVVKDTYPIDKVVTCTNSVTEDMIKKDPRLPLIQKIYKAFDAIGAI